MPSARCPETGRFLPTLGMYIDSKGYWCYSYGELRGKRVHRVLMERKLGRKLNRDEVCHHKDGNKLNNDLSNLKLMGEREHNAVYAKQLWYLKRNVWPKEEKAWKEYFEAGSAATPPPVTTT